VTPTLDQNRLDTLTYSPDFSNADPNDLAIAYMIALEGGISNSTRFQSRAEATLVANLMDLKQPVMARLYSDLVSQPILPVLTPNSPLRVAMRIWGDKGEVYARWAKFQQNNGVAPIDRSPDRNRGEWARMPWEFWANEDIQKMTAVRETTREELAENELYKQRYRAFHGLPAWADTEFDPYLDFKIRLCLSTKMRDAGLMGTAFGIAAILRGGTPEDVMAAIDLGGFADTGAMAIGGRGHASDALNTAISYSEKQSPVDRRGIVVKTSPPVPLSPVLMKKQQYADERAAYGTGTLYRHTLNKGGFGDIFNNQRLLSSAAGQARGGQAAVRAYKGPFVQPYAKRVIGIEFRTAVKPANPNAYFMGGAGAEWIMEEGEYLPISIVNVLSDGTLEKYDGPPKPIPQANLISPPANWQKPAKPLVLPGVPPIAPHPAGAKPAPRATPAPAARKLTMRELMVANVLTRDWQSVGGIYLQTGISDTDLAPILEMLVTEGYAEKQPDAQRAGWNEFRATPEWAAFLKK